MDQPDKTLFGGDSMDKEVTQDFPTISEGYYIGVMGRSYKSESKNGYKSKDFEVLLLKQSVDPNAPVFQLLDYKEEGGKLVLSLRKNKQGELITDSVVYPIKFFDIRDTQSQKAKAFFTSQRRMFARAFGAINEENGVIDWGLIQQQVGQVVSFNLVKNTRNPQYVNLDFETFGIHTASFATQDSIKNIYMTLDALQKPKDGTSLLPEEPPF